MSIAERRRPLCRGGTRRGRVRGVHVALAGDAAARRLDVDVDRTLPEPPATEFDPGLIVSDDAFYDSSRDERGRDPGVPRVGARADPTRA